MPQIPDTSPLLSVTEAAALIGVHKTTIHYAVHHGLIQAQRYGPYWLIRTTEALRYQRHRPQRGRPRKQRARAD